MTLTVNPFVGSDELVKYHDLPVVKKIQLRLSFTFVRSYVSLLLITHIFVLAAFIVAVTVIATVAIHINVS